MIVVNTPGSTEYVYPSFTHAEWHGWTFADLIFPSFLFIVGVALTLALAHRRRQGALSRHILMHTFRRAVVLFVLGLFLTNFPSYDFATLRFPGILQRIALCYGLATLIVLKTNVRGQAVVTVGLLAVYWILLRFVPVPGFGAGGMEKEGNLAAYVDTTLLRGHLFRENWDPEGLLSTIPALGTTLLGVLTGHWLQADRSRTAKAYGLLLAGGAGVILGQVMHLWFPINKNLWTSSYVVFSGGIALFILGLCYWLVDIKGYRRFTTPCVIFGVNPLTVYVLATLGARVLDLEWSVGVDAAPRTLKTFVYDYAFASWAGPTAGSLLFALAYACLWLAPMMFLYRRKIFIKI
jgi:predicted acyltransferase